MTTKLTDEQIAVLTERIAREPRFDGARVHVHPDDLDALLAEVRASRSSSGSGEREALERIAAWPLMFLTTEARSAALEMRETALRALSSGSPAPAAAEPPRAATVKLTAIVNGQDVSVEAAPGEPIGVLAHRVLAAEGYTWLTVEARDERGAMLGAREPAAAHEGKTIRISPPVGHGG